MDQNGSNGDYTGFQEQYIMEESFDEDFDGLVKLTEDVERMYLLEPDESKTEAEHIRLISERIYECFKHRPKAEQTEAIKTLLYDREDMIVIAKTGFGKSIIFQALPLIRPDKRLISLIIMPLNVLQEEQAAKLNQIDGVRAIVLNQETYHDANARKAIGRGLYTHVFSGPEIVVDDKFQKDVLQNPNFQAQIGLVAVDELHLVEEWGSTFRPTFCLIGQLRQMLPFGTPFLGVTATLTPKLLEKIRGDMGFRKNVRTLRTSIDRPEIYIATDAFQHTEVSMLDLQYLLPPEAPNALCIPKTIVYMQSKGEITQAVKLFHNWMSQLEYPPKSRQWVEPYHADLAEYDRDETAKSFGLPNRECTACRILIATDSYGLGIDNPDVERVVQWGVPQSLCAIYQRAGRAMRHGHGKATFILLHPKWCLREAKAPSSGGTTKRPTKSTLKQQGKVTGASLSSDSDGYNERHNLTIQNAFQSASQRKRDSLPMDISEFLNQGGCYRRASLAVFGDQTYRGVAPFQSPDPCCSYCHPGLIDRTSAISKVAKPLTSNDNDWKPWRLKLLKEWREQKCAWLFKNCVCEPQADLVLPEKVLEAISIHWGKVVDVKSLWNYAGVWGEAELYIDEIFEIISSIPTTNIQEHPEAMQELRNFREDKRKRRQSRITEPQDEDAEFEARRNMVVNSIATSIGTRGKSKSKRKGKLRSTMSATDSAVVTSCKTAEMTGEQSASLGRQDALQQAKRTKEQKRKAKAKRIENLHASAREKNEQHTTTSGTNIIDDINTELRNDAILLAGVLNGGPSRYQRVRKPTQRALGYPS